MNRLEKLKDAIKKANINGYLTTNVKSIYYLTGFMDISEATLFLITPVNGDAILLVQPLSYDAANEKAEGCTVKNIGFRGKILNKIVNEIRRSQMKSVVFDSLSTSMYLKLVQEMKEVEFKQDQDILMSLRRQKDEREIAFLIEAAKLADFGAEAGMEAIKPRIHEYEVAAEIEYAMRRRGSEGVAFETVVASGPRSAYPHGVCSDRIINEGELVVLDLGATYLGYRSDITRTAVVGKPTIRQKKIFDVVLKAQEEAFKSIHAKVRASDVDGVARKIITNEGFSDFFIHSLGHGVGLDIHEAPTLSPKSKEILLEGDVVTDEPGIYIPGFGGVRIEDTVLIHKNHGEKLTKTPYSF
ncbi:MAG: Aminopeptidase family protein [Thermoproteota archaeon]|nr:Aminopeptidase family protein [Thermoproteota archaeon]